VEDIDFKVIFALKIQIKFLKTRFWKEKSVEDIITLEPTAQATLVLANTSVNLVHNAPVE
jgi:hypothetical protein